jgi:pyruvate dehydrogenase E1 component alpha subunit
VQQAVEAFDAVDNPPAETLFDYVYAQWPAALAEQRDMLLERVARRKEARDE